LVDTEKVMVYRIRLWSGIVVRSWCLFLRVKMNCLNKLGCILKRVFFVLTVWFWPSITRPRGCWEDMIVLCCWLRIVEDGWKGGGEWEGSLDWSSGRFLSNVQLVLKTCQWKRRSFISEPEARQPMESQRNHVMWLRSNLQLVLHSLPSGIARGYDARQCVTDLNLESQGYCSYQGSMRSSADAEPPGKRHSREQALRKTRMIKDRVMHLFSSKK
jgi:hypothetical protein